MALITDFCHACNMLKPCDCDRLAQMKPVASLAVARFDKIEGAENHPPSAALEKALAHLADPNEPDYDHAIVVLGRTPEGGGSAAIWFQAGKYEYHAQMGLLFEAGQMIRENG